MTTKLLPKSDAITLTIEDPAHLWWPDALPHALGRLSPPTLARLVAVLGRLWGDVAILRAFITTPDRTITPGPGLVFSAAGSAMLVLGRGPEALEGAGFSRPMVEYFARYSVNDPPERTAWEHARVEFSRLPSGHQQEAFWAVRDRFQEVGRDLAGHRARLRQADAWLARVEAWLAGGSPTR